VSLLHSSVLAFGPAAGGPGDEVLRSCGEKVEFRPLQRAQRRSEVGIGEPLAQHGDSGLVLGTAEVHGRNPQAGIAKEAMNDPDHCLADLEIVEKTEIAVSRRGSLRYLPRGYVVVRQVAGERDVVPRRFRHGVETAVTDGVTLGLEAARLLDLSKLDEGLSGVPRLMSDVWHPRDFVPAQSYMTTDYKCTNWNGFMWNECTVTFVSQQSRESRQITDWRFGRAPRDSIQLLQRRDDASSVDHRCVAPNVVEPRVGGTDGCIVWRRRRDHAHRERIQG
jgi:hypothetical protein